MTKHSNGFTLVELAIALMVIGLLIGGVLKGQELIENARITQTMRQIKEFDTAVMIFRNTYNAFPGDIKNPGTRIANCTTDLCTTPGSGNGLIENDHETGNFFSHLSKAGMIKGVEGGTSSEWSTYMVLGSTERQASPLHTRFFPEMAVGFISSFGGYASNSNSYYIVAKNTREMSRLDQKMDDGMPVTGDFITETCAIATISGIDHYDVTDTNLCESWVASLHWQFQ